MFDYANPPHAIGVLPARDRLRDLAVRAAAVAEPFRCFLDTSALNERARRLGWADIEDLDRAALVARSLAGLPLAPWPDSGGDLDRMATR